MNGAFNPQILNVLDGRFTEHRVQTSRQRPLAGCQYLGNDVDRDSRVKVFTHPAVEPFDERVRMGKVIRDRIGRLR